MIDAKTRWWRPLRDIIAEHGEHYATVEDMIHEIDETTPGVSAWLKMARPPIAKLSSLLGLAVACEKVVIGGRLPHDIVVALSRTIMLPQTPVRNGMPFPLPRIVASELEGDPVAVALLQPISSNPRLRGPFSSYANHANRQRVDRGSHSQPIEVFYKTVAQESIAT